VGLQGGVGQGGGGRSTLERWIDSEAVQTASGGSVLGRWGAPVVIDECSKALQLEGDKWVRRGG
jgi:hypothetical protein